MKDRISRRNFLQIAGIAVAGTILTGCEPFLKAAGTLTPEPTALPTSPPSPSPAPIGPTATATVNATATPSSPAVTSTPDATGRPAIIRFYPDIPSRVIKTHAAGVWKDDKLDPGSLQAMVDASITKLTGLDSPLAAWQALFRPTERIAIKVNAFSNCRWWTHAALVKVVTGGLVAAGITAENILIFDQRTFELERAGFTLNPDGPGVRCIGSEGQYEYEKRINIAGVEVSITNYLHNCDAIINVPLLKQHDMAGISFALKNHFGSVNLPARLHGEERPSPARLPHSIAELNAQDVIRKRTRLVIGDALEVVLGYYWTKVARGNSILMSFDPVAHDAVGLQHFRTILEQRGDDPAASESLASQWLALAAGLGLGTHEMKNIELLEQSL